MARPIIKLEHGGHSLDLQDAAGGASGRYKCVSFAPPTAARNVTFGRSERGSSVQSKELRNIRFRFEVHIRCSSIQEVERGKRELQSFLNRAGDENTPLYLAYRSYDDYDYEPTFGLLGSFARYEVVHGELGQSGTIPQYTANSFLNVPVDLIIKPQVIYPLMPSGQATGGIHEDYYGTGNGKSRGTIIPRQTTNKMTNPAFMHSTFNNNWTNTNCLDSENKDMEFVLFGDTSARVEPTAADATFVQSINVGGTQQHTLSFYAKLENGGAITSSELQPYYGSAQSGNYVSMGDGWYWIWVVVTGVNAATDTGVVLAATLSDGTEAVFVDGFQIEQTSAPTPFCYGDMLGVAWDGTKNDSTSTRTVGRLRYNYDEILNKVVGFTIRVVYMPYVDAVAGSDYLFEDSDNDLALWIDAAEKYNFQTSATSSIITSAVTLTPGTPEIIHVTYDGVTATIYRNGSSLNSGATSPNTALPTYLYMGTDSAAASPLNMPIMDFATFPHVMTATEITADYDAVAQQATDKERIGPLPWFFTEDGDNIVDNDSDGTLFNYAVVGGLMGDEVDVACVVDSSNDFTGAEGISLGILPVEYPYFDPDAVKTRSGATNSLLFWNGQAQADADANNNEVKRSTLGTTKITLMSTDITTSIANILKHAHSAYAMLVSKDASANTNVQIRLLVMNSTDSADGVVSAWRTLNTSNAFRPFNTFEMPVNFGPDFLDGDQKAGFRIEIQRTAGASTENFDTSHITFFINAAAAYTGDIGTIGTPDHAYIKDRTLYTTLNADPTEKQARRALNRPITLKPDTLNTLMVQHTFDNFDASKTSWTTGYNLEFEQFAVAPLFDIF